MDRSKDALLDCPNAASTVSTSALLALGDSTGQPSRIIRFGYFTAHRALLCRQPRTPWPRATTRYAAAPCRPRRDSICPI